MENGRPPETSRERALRLSATMILIASLALNVALSARLRQTAGTKGGVAPGTQLPSLSMRSSDGESIAITYGKGERPSVFYYYSPTCQWCERNWPSLESLVSQVSSRFRFVAVSTVRTERPLLAGFSQPVRAVYGLTPEIRRQYGFGGTPHTLVVSDDGRALRSWVGAYTGEVRRDVEAYFGVRLPSVDRPQP